MRNEAKEPPGLFPLGQCKTRDHSGDASTVVWLVGSAKWPSSPRTLTIAAMSTPSIWPALSSTHISAIWGLHSRRIDVATSMPGDGVRYPLRSQTTAEALAPSNAGDCYAPLLDWTGWDPSKGGGPFAGLRAVR